jgi:hypothetical protein
VKIRVATEETGLIVVCGWLVGWLFFLLLDPIVPWSTPSGGAITFFMGLGWFVGYGVLALSRWWGRDDGRILVRFLCEVLKAEEEKVRPRAW